MPVTFAHESHSVMNLSGQNAVLTKRTMQKRRITPSITVSIVKDFHSLVKEISVGFVSKGKFQFIALSCELRIMN